MNLIHHIPEILGLEIFQYLCRLAFYLFHVPDGGSAAVVNGDDAGHEFVPALVICLVDKFDCLVDFVDAVVDDLDAVMEVGELVLLAADVGCDNVFEHLRDVVLRSLLLVLLVSLLLVGLLRGEVLLVLLRGFCVVTLVLGLLVWGRVCGGDSKLVGFKGIGIFGRGGTDAEVVTFWKGNLGGG